jgi:hypothetical protein
MRRLGFPQFLQDLADRAFRVVASKRSLIPDLDDQGFAFNQCELCGGYILQCQDCDDLLVLETGTNNCDTCDAKYLLNADQNGQVTTLEAGFARMRTRGGGVADWLSQPVRARKN